MRYHQIFTEPLGFDFRLAIAWWLAMVSANAKSHQSAVKGKNQHWDAFQTPRNGVA
jgi:hypothetical protein